MTIRYSEYGPNACWYKVVPVINNLNGNPCAIEDHTETFKSLEKAKNRAMEMAEYYLVENAFIRIEKVEYISLYTNIDCQRKTFFSDVD